MERVDLMFIHALDDDADYGRIMGANSVLKALDEFRAAGRIRYIGVSGHWYRKNMVRLLEEYPLDAVLCPVGLFNLAYDYPYTDDVLPLARKKGMAVMGMKVFGAGRVKHAASIEPYLRYSLNLPIDTAVIGCDSIAQLEEMIELARQPLAPLTNREVTDLLPECKRVTQSWDHGEFNWVSHYLR
jgi:predicted aldo/keto reductase-like oxidoreductase